MRNTTAGFNVSVVSEPPRITLVFSNVQVSDAGPYKMRVHDISENKTNLVVYSRSVLKSRCAMLKKVY